MKHIFIPPIPTYVLFPTFLLHSIILTDNIGNIANFVMAYFISNPSKIEK